jgi:hypothetical protein
VSENSLTITDNRTDRTYTLPIENGAVRAMDIRQIKTGPEDFGLMTYDPAFLNTASCHSSITFIDGENLLLSSGALRLHASPFNPHRRMSYSWAMDLRITTI